MVGPNRHRHLRHPNDAKPPEGFQYVRIDGYDPRTPTSERTYVQVPTGYGEGARAQAARGGLPNMRKIINKIKAQIRDGKIHRVRRLVLPPMSRVMRNLVVQRELERQLQEEANAAQAHNRGR